MGELEKPHSLSDETDTPSESDVEELRRKLAEAELHAKDARPATPEERRNWADELEQMRAESAARKESVLEYRGSGRQEPGFVPQTSPDENREPK